MALIFTWGLFPTKWAHSHIETTLSVQFSGLLPNITILRDSHILEHTRTSLMYDVLSLILNQINF